MAQTLEATKTKKPPAAQAAAAAYRPPYGAAAIATLAVFALYAITLAPSTQFWDTSEYIATAHILGIPHPPGNPLFVVLARSWELLMAPTGLSVAMRVNLFSAAMSALAHGCWFLVAHRILASFSERRAVRLIGAAAAVLISATAFTVWNQSNVNEKVYTVSLFTIALLSWLGFRWRDRIEARLERPATPASAGEHRAYTPGNLLILMIYILALSVGNHLMAFLAAPALAMMILLVYPRAFTDWRLYAAGALAVVIGLSIHLYLPLRASLDPVINEADPSTMQALWEALTRQQYDKPSVLLNPIYYPAEQVPRGLSLMIAQAGNYLQYFDWQWARSVAGNTSFFGGARPLVTLLFIALGGYGAWAHYQRERVSFWYIAVLLLTLSAALTFYLNFRYGYSYPVGDVSTAEATRLREVRERDYFFIASFSLWGLWSGIGLTAAWQRLAGWVRENFIDGRATGGGPARAHLLAAPVLALALIPLALNWSWASRAGDYSARDWAHNLLMSVEPYGVLFTNGDNDTFPLWYLQEVEGIRQDVTVIVMSYLNTPWYVRQLKQLTTPCPEGVSAQDDPTRIICQREYEVDEGPDFYAEMLERGAEEPDAAPPGHRPPRQSIIPLSDEQIEQVAAMGYVPLYRLMPDVARGDSFVFGAGEVRTRLSGSEFMVPADMFQISILTSSIDDRPIYFATTTNAYQKLRLRPYLIRQGVAYKLHDGLVSPDSAPGVYPLQGRMTSVTGPHVDLARTDALLGDVFIHRSGLPDEWTHWVDQSTQGIPHYYAFAHYAVGQARSLAGDDEAARTHIERAEAWIELGNK